MKIFFFSFFLFLLSLLIFLSVFTPNKTNILLTYVNLLITLKDEEEESLKFIWRNYELTFLINISTIVLDVKRHFFPQTSFTKSTGWNETHGWVHRNIRQFYFPEHQAYQKSITILLMKIRRWLSIQDEIVFAKQLETSSIPPTYAVHK